MKTRQKKQNHFCHDSEGLIFCRYAKKVVRLNLHSLCSLGKETEGRKTALWKCLLLEGKKTGPLSWGLTLEGI